MNERGSNKYGYEKKQVSDTNLYLFSITTANFPMRKLWHEDDVVSIVLELNELKKENEQLKQEQKVIETEIEQLRCINYQLKQQLKDNNLSIYVEC